MTAQRKIASTYTTTDHSALHSGDGVHMFSSGSAPMTSDALMGDGVEMFSSGSAPVTGALAEGAVTGLFSSGS